MRARERMTRVLKRRGDVWLFAYGSLMWEPVFDYREARRARLSGYHRAFCIYSHVYRGTPKRPGLVLGLDLGGSCQGLAFRLPYSSADETLAHIHEREMITGVYVPRELSVTLFDSATGAPQQRVRALAFVANRRHPQYAGKLAPRRAAELIRDGEGEMGSCRAYLEHTMAGLNEHGIADAALQRLHRMVRGRSGKR
jgi:cation transport protein ChaC